MERAYVNVIKYKTASPNDIMMVDIKSVCHHFLLEKENDLKEMGRPEGGTNRCHSKEEKLALVKRNLTANRY